MVEVEGQDTLVAACDNEVHEGMVIHTNSQKVAYNAGASISSCFSASTR